MSNFHSVLLASVAIVLGSSVAFAQDADAGATGAPAAPAAQGSVTLSTTDGAAATADTSGSEKPWIDRYAPEAGMFELGASLGVLFVSDEHNFQLESRRHHKLGPTPEAVLRASWLPFSFLGIEGEAGAGATRTGDDDVQSYPWTIRGQLIAQIPAWSVVPFAVVGLGELGNISNSMGSDGDPLTHFGIGAKVFFNKSAMVRLDLRDNMTQKNNESDGTMTHHPELMLGLSVAFGRSEETPKVCAPEDTDGDGIVDRADACPTVPGQGRDGCPIKDTDGDGILDDTDKCPTVPGVAPDGCPADRDGDGIPDATDKCPDEKGPAPEGCPGPKDRDGDGFLDNVDKCPDAPETKNGYQDTDGCPDDIPEKMKKFTGTIKGITFELNKAVIRPTSKPTLDNAAVVLNEFPDIRVLIVGHTDNTGTRERNLELSGQRAESVRNYMAGKGVAADRIETKGAGPDEPVQSNDTAKGREENRRIEFRLLMK